MIDKLRELLSRGAKVSKVTIDNETYDVPEDVTIEIKLSSGGAQTAATPMDSRPPAHPLG